MDSEKNNVMDSDQSNEKGYEWYSIDDPDDSNKIRKPKFSSNLSKKRLTSEEIQQKLESAEKRRKDKNERKSRHAAENREKMFALAQKIDKLVVHQAAQKKKVQSKETYHQNILDKREYCKIAAEVSMEFENLTKRYERALAVTKP